LSTFQYMRRIVTVQTVLGITSGICGAVFSQRADARGE
jgi:hypothetical protein